MRFLSYGGLLRAARRHADLSQRELARKAGVAVSVVSRIEAGRTFPVITTLERLLAATGFTLQATSPDGHLIDNDATWADQDATRDGAYRRFPAHLDTREHTPQRPWWYWFRDTAGKAKPPLLTFNIERSRRDHYRWQDRRTNCDPDERLRYPFAQSRVIIPGWRPAGAAGAFAAYDDW